MMQVSIVVPMLVVWWRRRHFSPPVKSLSWYVYLSAAGSLISALSYPAYTPNNYGFIIGFNLGKVALFGAVYHQVMEVPGLRKFVAASALAAVSAVGVVIAIDLFSAVALSRVVQCALLAAFALVYLEQTLTRPGPDTDVAFTTRSPLWLVGLGQLLYSAGTVTAFSLEALSQTKADQSYKYIFIALAGMVFNWFLTLAFLRARRSDYSVAEVKLADFGSLVSS
jgi:hypothetical protein